MTSCDKKNSTALHMQQTKESFIHQNQVSTDPSRSYINSNVS